MKDPMIRSEIYRLLAEAFKPPTIEFVAEQRAIVEFLRQSFLTLAYEIPDELYENWPSLLPDLPAAVFAYRQSFLFPVEARIVPVESVYRRWTHDAAAEMPPAFQKGLLMSDHALHMKMIFDEAGIRIPDEYRAMPDHLCIELEFAALLLEQQQDASHRQFIHEHLNWLDDLEQDAVTQAIPEYYRLVVKLTAQFLALELHR